MNEFRTLKIDHIEALDRLSERFAHDETYTRFIQVMRKSYLEKQAHGLTNAIRFQTTEKARKLLRERLHNE